MADIKHIIQTIMANPKIATSDNFAAKVYRDEPILISARQMETFTPPEIREMRKLARPDWPTAKIFHEQGMFMEAFDDDFPYRGEFVQYFPTYQAMTDAQLRGYFSWRGKVRRGAFEGTSLSFVFVYIYELLNRIGVRSAEDGFYALKNFHAAYREIDPRIDSYVSLWLKDYAVYHNLDKSLLDGVEDVEVDKAAITLLDCASRKEEEVFAALNSLSAYDLANSKFYREHPEDVTKVVHRVFNVVSKYYNRNPEKSSAQEKFFGRMCVNPYVMFKSAVFYPREAQEDRVYAFNDWHKYICRNGEWSCERFVWYGRNNKQIGALLKTVDYLMRRSYGHKSSLQPGKTNKTVTAKIEKEIAAYEQEKRDNAPREIAIDVSRLHAIRAAAQVTRDRLLVEEETDAPAVAAKTEETVPTEPENAHGLNEAERRLLHCLLYDGKADDSFRAKGLMISVLVDGINEKLFPVFNDTVIVDETDGPAIIEEYGEELKGMFPQ